MQDADINVVAIPAGLNRGGAGIAGCRADNGDPLAALLQHMIKQSAQKLHRNVFERQGRAVEQAQAPTDRGPAGRGA